MIKVNSINLQGNEKKYINQCIDDNWISGSGKFNLLFEKKIQNLVKKKYAISTTNGTTALETAVQSLNLKKGDEVILPSFTIISCFNAIVKNGLIPVPVDCNFGDWNMDIEKLKKKITNKTKAIIVVHIYGLASDIKEIIKLKKNYDFKIIEDAAESMGLKYYDNKYCGYYGDITTFSFYANKHITTGEGGMILTNKKNIADRCKSIINLFFSTPRFIHSEVGSNHRYTNIQAAIGLAQYEKLKFTIKRKIEIGNMYQNGLKNLQNIFLPQKNNIFSKNIYWVFGLVLKNDNKLKLDRQMLCKKLYKKGIETRPFFGQFISSLFLKNLKKKN
tara:strand:- start:54 stop:1049 length:996 start_codon:yes stop_codon:yes gene_type:complete